ncbi:MAG: choice-of-anchor tandem repeat GloVer-containing protein [Verrucomicrobiota bacterium]
MKVRIKIASWVLPLLLSAPWSVPTPAGAFTTNTVEKVADLFSGKDLIGNIYGGYNPESRFTQVGTNLWFTTAGGGLNGDGTISTFSLISHEVTQVAYLDKNTSGKAPDSPILVINETNGYFTTTQGGSTSNKGTIVKIDLPSGTLTTLHAFTNTDGATPRTGLTEIGNELWTMTSMGGTSNKGTIVKYNLDTDITTVVTNFDGPNIGGYPYANPVHYDNAWYFTTFVGGTNIVAGAPLGTGAFDRLTFDDQGNPLITKLIDLPNGYVRGPCGSPLLVGTNSFYFLTTGPTTNPGAIYRYDLDTGLGTNLFSFTTNADALLQDGKVPGYNGLTEWQGELYFLTRQGGISNVGVVAKFNIASNTVVKLADLDGKGPLALGYEMGGFNNDGLVVQETNRFFIYYTVYAGGAYGSGSGYGTILRIYLPPLPIQAAIAPADPGSLTVSWSGGYPPFDIVTNNDLTIPVDSWPVAVTGIDSAVNTTNWSATLPVPGGPTFYRIRGQTQ